MKKLFVLVCVLAMIFTFAVTQATAGGQQKGAQTGQSSQLDKQDQKAGAAGQSTMDRSGQLGPGIQQDATQVSRISELMDKKVKNDQGQDLGQIEDLVVGKDGRISYIILSQGGVMGIGDKLTPIPFKNAQFNQEQDEVILSGIDKQKLENAPTISQDDWQRLSDPGFERELFSYYGQEKTQPGMGSGAAGSQQRPGSSQMKEPGSSGMQQPRSGEMQPGQQSPMQQGPGQTAK
ncbi:MAG: PRC-barrel domain-containing protein [Desulfobacterales bacterium]|nr:PRC-barrel domain-containing protein [Desulfobacterales bacterium]